MATEYVQFTPGGGSDPLTIGPFTDGTLIHSIWAPTPTNLFKVLIPNPNGAGYVPLPYQLQEVSGEIISFGNNGYASIQIQSDGTGGAPFYIAATDQLWAPFKEDPVLSVPPIIDLSSLGVYNFQRYGASPTALNSVNDTALSNMLTAMAALNNGAGGGWAWIAPASFGIDANNFSVPSQTCFKGAGKAVAPGPGHAQFSITGNATFLNCAGGGGSPGGASFSDIAFAFAASGIGTSSRALNLDQWGAMASRCVFTNCPTAAALSALRTGLEACAINYQAGPNGGGTAATALAMVKLTAPETFVRNCEFQQLGVGSGGPTGIAAIAIGGMPSEHAQIEDVHLSDFSYGIIYTLNGVALCTHARGIECQSWITGLYMQPSTNTQTIFGERYTDCRFSASNNSTSVTPQVYIDTNGGPNANVDDIQFTALQVWQSLTHGIVINQGQGIVFNGGRSSGNGGIGATNGAGGIAITGPCGNVTVNGMDLRPGYPNATNVYTQQYALVVTGTSIPGVIRLVGCDLTGYTGSALHMTGSFAAGGRLYINLCPGYNNVPITVLSGAPGSVTTAAANGFWGPVQVVATASGSATVIITPENSGPSETVTLSTGQTFTSRVMSPYDQVAVTGSFSLFTMKNVWA